jgi:hypothetical protein
MTAITGGVGVGVGCTVGRTTDNDGLADGDGLAGTDAGPLGVGSRFGVGFAGA